jgi:hypothetical protein
MNSNITRLPDGSGFFVRDIDTSRKPPANPVYWNPGNKVVQDHRNGEIDHTLTNIERAKRGLPVPWTPTMAESETRQADIP